MFFGQLIRLRLIVVTCSAAAPIASSGASHRHFQKKWKMSLGKAFGRPVQREQFCIASVKLTASAGLQKSCKPDLTAFYRL
jgi:hypothetical protein